MKQKKTPCHTCPWVQSTFGDCFDPARLEKTVVADMHEDRLQSCHSNHNQMCAGALAFANNYGDLFANLGVRMAAQFGDLQLDMIDPTIETYQSIPEMLESHAVRWRE